MNDMFYKVVDTLLEKCNLYNIEKMKTEADEIEFIKKISSSNGEGEKHFQLPLESDYSSGDLEKKHLKNPYKGMLINNPYFKLYEYLQTSPDFKEIQTKTLKLHMGLFAYADREIEKLRYLYGPCTREEDKGKSKPHFFLRAYSNNDERQFEDEPSYHFTKLMDTFYYGRTSEHWKDLNFIKFLADNADNSDNEVYSRRTEFEHKNGIIYAPSGEMDACILCWLLLSLANDVRTQLLKEIEKETFEIKFDIDLSSIRPRDDTRWYAVDRKTLLEWLRVLGLLEQPNGTALQVTELGKHMVAWLDTYLKTLKGEDVSVLGNEDKDFFEIIGTVSGLETRWLKGLDEIIKSFREEENEQKKFLAAVKLLLSWNEGEGLKPKEQLMQFQSRCRFNLYGHLMLRAADRGLGTHETSARAWIVFPVLADVDSAKDDSKKLVNVGFFLGTFKDSADNGESYFANYENYKTELIDIISKTKIIMNALASVENREIYYKEIVKMHILKHGTKAAILSIDVRNLSHNIGSHVLAYWMQELNQLLKDSGDNNSELQKAIHKSKALLRYIQHRADFLAEVATSIPCSEMSLNLKKDILAPFLDGVEPYTTNDSLNSGGLPLDSNVYVLLRYIAESEGITINFDADDKKKKIITWEIDNSLKENDEAVYVSIPSGIIGKHAIYSILENFIRNAAKHYKGTGPTTKNSYFIKIKVSKPETTEKWKDDYVAVEIIDVRENSCNCDIVKNLNNFIKGSFVKEDGSLESGGWGIKEMLISANFLRKNTPEYLYDVILGNITCNPPLLEIICKSNDKNEACDNKNCCKECKTDNNLAIRFYLKKPKHLAIMVDSVTKESIDKKVFEINKIEEDDFKGRPIPHNILLVDKSKYDTYKDNPIAPCRVMPYDAADKGENTKIDDNCYLQLYDKFIKDEIWENNTSDLPKIINNLGENYEFEERNATGLCIQKLNSQSAQENICFVSHPEDPQSQAAAAKYFSDSYYFQPMSGGFSTKAKLFKNHQLNESIRRNFYLELRESALTKVVIVDERISEWADKKSKYQFGQVEYKTHREVLAKMKVYAAKIEKENLSTLEDKLNKEVLGCSVLNSEDGAEGENLAHFFVIHQGILDKLNDKNFMDKIKCRWKVIDSGRGVPEEIDYRFVQISALQTLLENYDKHGLVQTLFSLRKPVKEEQSGNQS